MNARLMTAAVCLSMCALVPGSVRAQSPHALKIPAHAFYLQRTTWNGAASCCRY